MADEGGQVSSSTVQVAVRVGRGLMLTGAALVLATLGTTAWLLWGGP